MIKPNEITIGSLLRTNNGEIIRVESISTKRQHRKVGYHREGDPCHIHYVRLAQCEGIELTEGILIMNGFRESIEEDTWYFPEGCKVHKRGYAIEKEIDCIWYITDHLLMPITYVHQLQFALFLCGLDEVADNFKLL